MQYTLSPADPLKGPLNALVNEPTSAFTPVAALVAAVGAVGTVQRLGDWTVLVDVPAPAMDAVMATLVGWSAHTVQRTRSETAFAGMLAHHFGQP